ncbi:hypothetical protein [Paraburkholderia domus]|uniref:hypothetical protein n=1 Tax=Paraburkholderia domus TaxID=2793075 RepID=UPI001911F5B7|nr:hypothetical protein [Paraburkholderia domus]MBK5186115.1 hypothetical protein [Burkholderia sp. R-69749]MCI0150210.1 hypothetical protein [Paraburkholderia sediminicola]CAE6900254.1 hypothetical protein R69749_08107 [Paraburkholderia domus]
MDYYQGVVTEFLRADRAVFVNTECCIQLHPGASPDVGTHWYCDAVAINMRERQVFLCEITYSKSLDPLLKRLTAWCANWSALRLALVRDLCVPADWPVTPWVFIPSEREGLLERKLARLAQPEGDASNQMPKPKVTHLERVAPWNYNAWNRKSE